MRIHAALVLTLGLLLSAPVSAKDKEGAPKYPTIEMTGVKEFDGVFEKGKNIHDTLATAENKLTEANKNLATTLGVPETTSIDEMLGELKKKANNKITVAMEGGKPKIKASDAVPEDVQKGIDAVNQMVDDLQASLDAMKDLPPQVQELITSAKGFPSQLKPELLTANNLTAKEMPKVAKTMNSDIKAIVATPDRIKGVTDASLNIFQQIQAAFAG